jgi:hypothetical protein
VQETSTLRENVNTTLIQVIKGYSRNWFTECLAQP